MSTGGVYVSEDGGEKWEPRNRGITVTFGPDPLPEYGQCVHKVAVDAGDPDRLYAQNHFGVFRSDDAGSSWTSIAGGLPADFGFPIVVLAARRPGTAWVVPLVADMQRVPPDGRLRVHRTRDAGETWTELGDGPARRRLGGGHARRVLRRRGDPTGIYVGTRDGCVYASADEGDTFTLVADHLPDVLDGPRGAAAVTVQVLLPGVLAALAGGEKHVRRRAGGRHPRRPARRAGRRAPDARPADPRRDRPGAAVRERLRRRGRRALRGRAARRRCATARTCRCCRRSPAAERLGRADGGTSEGGERRRSRSQSCWSS